MSRYIYKIATEPREFELIHRLNHKTFVEEIPQHHPNPDGRLVDRFHGENLYLIALYGDTLAGMIAYRDKRPFSLDQKLPDLDRLLPPGHRPCEFRLLAVEKNHRRSAVFYRLFFFAAREGLSRGKTLGLISGTTRQLRLYQRLGFTPFGPLVGTPDAPYQPMYMSLETISSHTASFLPADEKEEFLRYTRHAASDT
ncbi:MAG: GNAT family N-acyltransferase [Planctomycetota bacterium]